MSTSLSLDEKLKIIDEVLVERGIRRPEKTRELAQIINLFSNEHAEQWLVIIRDFVDGKPMKIVLSDKIVQFNANAFSSQSDSDFQKDQEQEKSNTQDSTKSDDIICSSSEILMSKNDSIENKDSQPEQIGENKDQEQEQVEPQPEQIGENKEQEQDQETEETIVQNGNQKRSLEVVNDQEKEQEEPETKKPKVEIVEITSQ